MPRDTLDRLERALEPGDLEAARAYFEAARRRGEVPRAYADLMKLGWTLQAVLDGHRGAQPETALDCAAALLHALTPIHTRREAFGGLDPRRVLCLPGKPWHVALPEPPKNTPHSAYPLNDAGESCILIAEDWGRGAQQTETLSGRWDIVMGAGSGKETNWELASGARLSIEGDPLLSRRHARTLCLDGRVIVLDLQSVQGTWINGARLRAPQVVRSGDRIAMGQSLITFYAPDEPPIPLWDLHVTPPGGYQLTPEDDLYSVACVLYQMLLGTPLFKAESAGELMHAHAQASRPGLPTAFSPSLRRLLAATLAAERVLRPSTAADMLEILQRVRQG